MLPTMHFARMRIGYERPNLYPYIIHSILMKIDKQLFMVGVNFIVKSRLKPWITEEWYQNNTGETKEGSSA